MITLYLYEKLSGLFKQIDKGIASELMRGLVEEYDYTLTPPPDYENQWRWIDDKWLADEPEDLGILPSVFFNIWVSIQINTAIAALSNI